MRKLLALILVVALVFPLLLASQLSIAAISWALDRQFYTNALQDAQIEDSLVSDKMLDDLLRSRLALMPETDTQALVAILRSTLSDAYLQGQADTFINGLFDNLQGQSDDFNPVIDLQPVKAALSSERQAEFLAALVAVLPICQPGQAPGLGAAGQTVCKPDGISDELLIEGYLKPLLPTVIAQMPDQVSIGGDSAAWQSSEPWRAYLPARAMPAALLLAILLLTFVTLGFWYITALIAAKSGRARLQWLGWTLLIPSALVFLTGLLVQSDAVRYWLNFGLQRVTIPGTPAFFAYGFILQTLGASALNRVSLSFLIMGGIGAGLALALLLWGLLTPRRLQPETIS